MSVDASIELYRQMLVIATEVAGPPLAIGLLVGLVVAILQAATQVQESTLNFLPKLAAVLGSLLILGPWALGRLAGFATLVFEQIARSGPGVP